MSFKPIFLQGLTMAKESAVIVPGIICVLLFLLAWHIVEIVLGFEYESDTCDVPLDYWCKVAGAVGIGFVGLMMIAAFVIICQTTGGIVLLCVLMALYGLWKFAWTIYGMVLLFDDDGLRCKLDDHGHDKSLWVYVLVNVILSIAGVVGGGVGAGSLKSK